ncbi:MFS transporter [Haloplanus salilacus]|uniref:MFS transporter n=1 Tax=Haloplanus salilacus TaxID=2949994 RepID=UPI0030CF9CA2
MSPQSPVESHKYRRSVEAGVSDRWLYAWGLASMGLGGASLIVPLYVVELGGGPVTLGILAAVAAVAGASGALGVGWLSDRTGRRRRYVLLAIGVVAVSMVVVSAVESIPIVIAANAAVWLAFAAALPVLTLLAVVDVPEPEWSDRIAALNRYQGIGWALGLLVGFLVIVAGERLIGLDPRTTQRVVSLVCATGAGIGGGVAARSLPADPPTGSAPAPQRLRRAIRGATRFGIRGSSFPFTPRRVDVRGLHPRRLTRRFTPELAVFFLAVVLAFTGFGAFFAPLPAYLAGVGMGSDGVFGLYLALNVAAAVFFGATATLSARYGATTLHAIGLAVRGIAFPAVVAVGGVLAPTVIVFGVIGLAWAVVAVTSGMLVTRLSPAIVRGEALGVYSALSSVASGIGGILGGWIAATGYRAAFVTAGGFVLVGTAVVLVLRWRIAHPSDEPNRVAETTGGGG